MRQLAIRFRRSVFSLATQRTNQRMKNWITNAMRGNECHLHAIITLQEAATEREEHLSEIVTQ